MDKRSNKARVIVLALLITIIIAALVLYRNVPAGVPAVLSYFLERQGGRLGKCTVGTSTFGVFEIAECEIWLASASGETHVSLRGGKITASSFRDLPALSAERIEIELPATSQRSPAASANPASPSVPFARIDVADAAVHIPGKATIDLSTLSAVKTGETLKVQSQLGIRDISAAPSLVLSGIAATGSVTPEKVSIELVAPATAPLEGKASAAYDFTTGSATARLFEAHAPLNTGVLLPLLHLPADSAVTNGTLEAEGELGWKESRITPDSALTLSLRDLTAMVSGISIRNAEVSAKLRVIPAVETVEPAVISVAEIQFGPIIHNFSARAALKVSTSGSSQLVLTELRSEFMDGEIRSERIEYSSGGTSNFSVTIDRVDLEKLLALTGDSVKGTGKISGVLPVTVEDKKISIHEGRLEGTVPGELSYRRGEKGDEPTGNPGLDLAFRALEEFHYQTLHSQVEYQPDGKLNAVVSLLGKNPKLFNGREIQFNVTVEENVPALLKSIRLATGAGKDLWKPDEQEAGMNGSPK